MATVQEALDRIWSDPSLKARLLSTPRPVLRELGMEIPDNIDVQVHENTPNLIHAVLPLKPASAAKFAPADPVGQLINKAWNDTAFRARLLSEPAEAAAENGIILPAGMRLKVWEDTETVRHLVLPANPAQSELSEFELEAVAGGSSKGGTVACDIATPGIYMAVGSTGGLYSPSAAANTSQSISSSGK